MTKDEIDLTMKTLIEAKKAGQFRAFWKDFNESVNLMASGETVIQSMWSPAVTKVRSMGIACTYQPLKEGYRAWAAGFGLPKTLKGKKLDAAYEFINWFLSGLGRRVPEPPGLLLRRAGDGQGQAWSPTSGPTGWRASRPRRTSRRPTAPLLEKAGAVRDGGSYEAAHGRASPAGTRSWTRTTTWSASGTSSSRRERRRGPERARRSGPRAATRDVAPMRGSGVFSSRRRRRTGRWRRSPSCSPSSSCCRWSLTVAGELLALQRVLDEPGARRRRTTPRVFSGCLAELPGLCLTLKTYLSTLKFCLLVWLFTLVDRLHASPTSWPSTCARSPGRWCSSSCAPSRSGPRTSSA